MVVINSIKEMRQIAAAYKSTGGKIAVVPTMGFLHQGHLSLINKAKEEADFVITSLFVNPRQFAPNEDYDKYPRNMGSDSELAAAAGSDCLFNPNALEMYAIGNTTKVAVEGITAKFEGAKRPGHFDGVATVVAKLFNATLPDIAVFGQKDYQQILVVKRLIEDLNYDIELIVAPTLRQADGLAMSSRNKYLSDTDRQSSSLLFLALEDARKAIAAGMMQRKVINAVMHKRLRQAASIKIDYACAALANSLHEPDIFLPGDDIVLLIAAYLGKTRLIDNALTTIPKGKSPLAAL